MAATAGRGASPRFAVASIGPSMDISMTLPTMLPHGRREVLSWCRQIDEGPWTSLAVPERVTFTSHALTVQLAAAAALTERVRLWTTLVVLPAHDAVQVAKEMASVDQLSDGRLTVGVGVGGRQAGLPGHRGRLRPPLAADGRPGGDHATHLGPGAIRSKGPTPSGRHPSNRAARRWWPG